MRRPSYFQKLLQKPVSTPVLKPPRQLMRPSARGFEMLDTEQRENGSAGTTAVAPQSAVLPPTPDRPEPRPGPRRSGHFETPPAAAMRSPAPGDASRQEQLRLDGFEDSFSPAPIAPRAAAPSAPVTDSSTPEMRPPAASARATTAATSIRDATSLHPRLEALDRAAERFAGGISPSGNTAASSLEPPPARAALAGEPKPVVASPPVSQPPPVAAPSSNAAAASSAVPGMSPAIARRADPTEPLLPRVPLRVQAAPPPQRPSVTIGTLEVRVTQPAQNVPPRPAMKARHVAPAESRSVSRPIVAFGFGQT
ncbi:hypothetical protein [Bradyrhizobium tropiciagri]|uniref:hypothetical protein n=1 Tax=Bradyrhizobium tropiciagri TaxID=312253 RepID=UPI000A4FAAC3|nr:hypothetical protein [Bradyrhizobium tropiciagri]